MTDCFLRCLRGMEGVAAVEVADRAGATVTAVGHREVRFSTAGPVDDLLDLRTVDDVFTLVATVEGVGRTRAELARIERALRDVTVDDHAGAVGRSPTVEVVGSFLGRRNFNRYELEDAAGPVLARALGGRYASRSGGAPVTADVSFRIHVGGDQLIVGRRVGSVPRHRRAYKRSTAPGSLHPPLAAAMVWLAGVEPGLRLIDPFCGSGTILAEAHGWDPSVAVVGLDASRHALDHARRNTVGLPLVRGDAGDPPVRVGSFDRVITNPPWGAQAPVLGRATAAGIPALVGGLLAAGGRSAVLVDESMESELRWSSEPDLRIVVSLFGRHPRLLVHGGSSRLDRVVAVTTS